MPDRYDYLLLKADGSQECHHQPDRPLSLVELQRMVGAEGRSVAFAPLADDPEDKLCLVVDEEGMLLGRNVNRRATELVGSLIVGDAVLTTREVIDVTPFRNTDEEETDD